MELSAVVPRVLTESELVTLEALAEALARKGLTEERDALLGVLRSGSDRRELSVSEAAALARKSSQTIRNWIKAGWLPARADETNHYYVPVDALLPMLRLRALKPEPPVGLVGLSDEELDARIDAAIDRARAQAKDPRDLPDR
jgi:hypothetical protein